MIRFKRILEDIYILQVPFGDIWTGVVLIKGEKNILIDSGPDSESVNNCIIPALQELKIDLKAIDLLLNTHCHGDHIGGHRRIAEEGVKIAAYEGSLDKIRNPLKYSKIIRSIYPEYSPSAPKVLDGVEPDLLIKNGERVGDRLRLVFTPGHDDDTVCWYDEKTKTIIAGDTLQGNGTKGQGIGLYMDLRQYEKTLNNLLSIDIENIIMGHDYLPLNGPAIGKEQSKELIRKCIKISETYTECIKEIINNGFIKLDEIAKELILRVGGIPPEFMFLALYTTETHLKYSNSNYVY